MKAWIDGENRTGRKSTGEVIRLTSKGYVFPATPSGRLGPGREVEPVHVRRAAILAVVLGTIVVLAFLAWFAAFAFSTWRAASG